MSSTEEKDAGGGVPGLGPQRRYFESLLSTDKVVRAVFNLFFTYTYLLLSLMYLSEYRGHLDMGFSSLSPEMFWLFQRDILLCVVGYLSIVAFLKRLYRGHGGFETS